MSSTNKTTHYDLSQYVSSDKPTYLTDYNGDMLKIDTAINTAKTTADSASTAASNAATAAETAQTTANTAITNAATADTKATTANTNIGTLANLTTTEKTSLVSAINEVDGKQFVVNTFTGGETNKAPSVAAVLGATKGTVLFSGTAEGNFQLSDSATNYDRFGILYTDQGGTPNGELIVDSSENTIVLHAINNTENDALSILAVTLSVSGTNVTYSNYKRVRFTNGNSPSLYNDDNTANKIKIIEVIGYKD